MGFKLCVMQSQSTSALSLAQKPSQNITEIHLYTALLHAWTHSLASALSIPQWHSGAVLSVVLVVPRAPGTHFPIAEEGVLIADSSQSACVLLCCQAHSLNFAGMSSSVLYDGCQECLGVLLKLTSDCPSH